MKMFPQKSSFSTGGVCVRLSSVCLKHRGFYRMYRVCIREGNDQQKCKWNYEALTQSVTDRSVAFNEQILHHSAQSVTTNRSQAFRKEPTSHLGGKSQGLTGPPSQNNPAHLKVPGFLITNVHLDIKYFITTDKSDFPQHIAAQAL